jgi:hypothetical protein
MFRYSLRIMFYSKKFVLIVLCFICAVIGFWVILFLVGMAFHLLGLAEERFGTSPFIAALITAAAAVGAAMIYERRQEKTPILDEGTKKTYELLTKEIIEFLRKNEEMLDRPALQKIADDYLPQLWTVGSKPMVDHLYLIRDYDKKNACDIEFQFVCAGLLNGIRRDVGGKELEPDRLLATIHRTTTKDIRKRYEQATGRPYIQW